jgi:hypothetical protein
MIPRLVRSATALLAVAALGLASVPAANAQIFKWVDERGVVNYSNEPPPNGTAQRVAPVQDRMSTSSAPTPAPSASTGASRADPMQDRIESLERQLDQERRERSLPTDNEAERRRRAYEECLRARGTDCDTLGELPAGVAPAVVFVPARRAKVVPTLPVEARDSRADNRRGRATERDAAPISARPPAPNARFGPPER